MSQPPSGSSILVEEHKRLSQSSLWRLQREYFENEGILAWVNQVPFYITSNPFIANTYAQVVLNFILDWREKHPETKDHPFYILELGAGSGRFSFYFIKTLMDMIDALKITDLRVCYVMSDITRNNIKYYETHHALMPYIEKGIVDFAIYNMEMEKPITLLRQHIQLDNKTLQNPLTVFANYIFDTVSQDAFTVYEKKLYESLISLKTEPDNLKDNRPISMEKLENEFHLREITNDYYPDPVLNKILEEYKTNLTQTSLLFPIGSIHAIKFLNKLSNNKLFIVSSDKGYSSLSSLDNHGHPSLSFHGSFSVMVNFHALSQFFKYSGGDYFMQSPRKGIKTSVFCLGMELDELPKTKLALKQYVEGFSPADYFTLHRRVSDSFQECALDTLASHMHLTRWDPHMYLKLKNRLISLVNEEGDPETLEFMASQMPVLAANFYHMPRMECILFEIGVFFHAIKNYPEALRYYEQARPFIGEQFSLYYNIALCQHHSGLNKEALVNFKHSLTLNAESKEAEEWVNYLEKQESEDKG